MPKRKTVDDTVTQPAAVTEVKKRSKSAASKPNTPAATHKRPSKKSSSEAVATSAPVPEVVAPKAARVPTPEKIAELAYSYWEARGRQHGFAEEDWLRAERTLSELA